MDCRRCGSRIIASGRGRSPLFCSTRCRVAAHRSRPRISAALTSRDAWTRRDGKRPITPDGRAASSTDPRTWTSFDAVQIGAGDGFGIMLGSGLGCFDLDHCLDGDALTDRAADLLASTPDPLWVERSMSGTGLHIFVAADEARGWKRDGVEFYSRARFIAVTGDPFTR